jgi:hypothetical protein
LYYSTDFSKSSGYALKIGLRGKKLTAYFPIAPDLITKELLLAGKEVCHTRNAKVFRYASVDKL